MPSPGKVVVGAAAIREALAGFLAARPTITTSGRLVAQTGDLAMLANRWTLALTGPDGKPTTMSGNAVELARRQPDGQWLFAMDMPFGTDTGGA
jgi:ketosteroid isomerase-like protein